MTATTKRQKVKSEPSADVRPPKAERKHLTEAEAEALIKAAGKTRHGDRDKLMCLLMYRHGLRVSELCGLTLTDLDLEAGRLMVRRLKGSRNANHPLSGDAIRLLRAYLRKRGSSPHRALFLSERGDPFTRQGLNYLVAQWAKLAALPFAVHPHMLRHGCGYALVNRDGGSKDIRLIQDYLGHKDPRHTVRYTELAAGRFEELWK